MVLGGILGGALGAVLWAAVAVLTNYEIGWIAWAVGGMVGYGVARGNRGVTHSPKAAGALAVFITLLSIPAGKYATIQLNTPSDEEMMTLLLEAAQDDEYVVSFLADEVVEELSSAGKIVTWPAGVDPANASTEEEYPVQVWSEASTRWADMTTDEREAFRGAVQATMRSNMSSQMTAIRAGMNEEAFLSSFSAMDLLFFGFAMVTAFGVAGGSRKTDAEVANELNAAIKLALMKVMLADGTAAHEEMQVVRGVYARLTGLELSEEDLKREVALTASAGRDLSAMLGELAPYLNNEGKALVVRAAFMVASADGVLAAEEKQLLGEIAAQLGMTDAEFRDSLSRLLQQPEEAAP